ncbi:hypothetical protein CROQUDRAFT_661965 [Cronartium quercuum f. sp. fusiforme G11]|uniref:Uncharacterized protein n=1 Tax=Cronartium quercuum f. sp. fusiforme G11 TaxID=708437 RepID=A0A9P6NF44_9BASI|nr:hypothetical protein CROQUDRAFT_661965 [Cronartium quercuum f. sp. fusiforme G11]
MCSIPLYVPASYHYLLFLYPIAFSYHHCLRRPPFTLNPIAFSYCHCFTTLYTTTTCLRLPPLTLDPIAFDLYPLAPIASRSQYSHPSVTTVHNLTIRPEFKNDPTRI